MELNPLLYADGYKLGHRVQYPPDTEYIYSNLTARKSRIPGCDGVIFFGLQYFIEDVLVRQFNQNFFQRPLAEVMTEYARVIDSYMGPGAVAYDHIEDLHKLGYLPIKIKALPEGSFVPSNVPVLTIVNTQAKFFWLTNYLETLLSCQLWKMSTNATTAFLFRQTFERYAEETGAAKAFIPWQGHDFSMRGMSGVEDAMMSGAAHLTSFTGTDTFAATELLRRFYWAEGLIGGSVPATEHSVMCMGGDTAEEATFRRLVTEVYPAGVVSIVSDTWNYWDVIAEVLPNLKDAIMAREGKVVIRPDSGDPVKIIIGDDSAPVGSPEWRGTVRELWDIFGGTTNDMGYRELDSHIGLIYGDGITREKQEAILEGLKAQGFASSNIVLGIGSFHYQLSTRDTCGFAMKATNGVTSRGSVAIYKDPATDRAVGGSKKSHRGLLAVHRNEDGVLYVKQDCTVAEEEEGLLSNVFINGHARHHERLALIRQRVEAELSGSAILKMLAPA